MELIASPCSWSWVKVLTSVTWCPVCCRDMFHKDLSTATESAAILSTAREMKVRDMTTSNNSPSPGPKCWNCPCGCPRGSNKSNWTVHQWHFRKSEASFPRLVQTVCLLLVAAEIFGLEEIHNYRSWLWASDNEQSGRPGAHHRLLGRQYNVLCNNWKLPAKITKIKAPRCFKVSRGGVFFYLQKRRQKWTLKTFHETM